MSYSNQYEHSSYETNVPDKRSGPSWLVTVGIALAFGAMTLGLGTLYLHASKPQDFHTEFAQETEESAVQVCQYYAKTAPAQSDAYSLCMEEWENIKSKGLMTGLWDLEELFVKS